MSDPNSPEDNPSPSRRLVFISHSSRDTWVARQIAAHIESLGAATFLDEANIRVGDDFQEEIRTALECADELVVLLTPWSLDRAFVWAEIGGAWVRRIRIVGLLHGVSTSELQQRPATPIILTSRDLIALNDFDQYLVQLAGRLRGDQP